MSSLVLYRLMRQKKTRWLLPAPDSLTPGKVRQQRLMKKGQIQNPLRSLAEL